MNHILVGYLSLLIFENCISTKAGCFRLLPQSANASGTAQVNKDVVELEVGKPVERTLKAGEIHTYRLVLSSNQFLRVIVDQRGIDVVVRVSGPDEKQITEVDSPNGIQGPEPVSLVSERAGSYRLEVRSLENGVAPGQYEVKIEELRSAIPQDSLRVAAEKVFQEAEQLRVQGTAESLRKAIEKYEELLPTVRSLSDRQTEAITLSNIGLVYDSLGELQKALEYYNEALPMQRSVGDRQGEAITLSNIGASYTSRGELQKALEYLSQALPIRRSVGDRQGEAITLNNIGASYTSLGELQKALQYYDQALLMQRSVGDRRGEAITLNNIGGAYRSLGEMQKALEYYDQALPIRRSVGDRQGEAVTLNNIGASYTSLGELQKALQYYDQALPIRRSVGDRRGEATTLSNIGASYMSLGEMQKALEYFIQALPIRRSVGDRRGEAITLINIGLVYDSLGELQKASDLYARSLLLSRDVGDPVMEAGNLYSIARVKLRQSLFAEARTNIEAALVIIESLRAKVVSPELRASYFASVQPYYQFYVDLLMHMHQLEPEKGYDALALQANELARARSLLEMLTEASADIRQGVDPTLLERERSLQQLLGVKSERLTGRLSHKPTDQQDSDMKKELEQLLTQYQEVQAQIRASSRLCTKSRF